MDWIDVTDHEWLATAFGDVNADGYFDSGPADVDIDVDGLTAWLHPTTSAEPEPLDGTGPPERDPMCDSDPVATDLDDFEVIQWSTSSHLATPPW